MLASQGTNFGRSERRDVCSQSIISGLEQASRFKQQNFSYGEFSSVQATEVDGCIDFGSSFHSGSSTAVRTDFGSKIVGCAGGSSRKKTTTASSTATSATLQTSTSAGMTKGRLSCQTGSGSGSNGGEDGEGNGRKPDRLFNNQTCDEKESANECKDEEEEEEEFEANARLPKTSRKLSLRQTSRHASMDDRVRRAAVEDQEVEGGNVEETEPVGQANEGQPGEVGGVRQVGESSGEGKFFWRTSSELNQDTFPIKSKAAYQDAYKQFETFLKAQGQFVEGVVPTEEAFLNYFSYLKIERRFASTTIWCVSAKLNACLKRMFGIRLQDYPCVSELMKRFDSGHEVKKAKNFSPQEVCL
jgi:hypothetical protein